MNRMIKLSAVLTAILFCFLGLSVVASAAQTSNVVMNPNAINWVYEGEICGTKNQIVTGTISPQKLKVSLKASQTKDISGRETISFTLTSGSEETKDFTFAKKHALFINSDGLDNTGYNGADYMIKNALLYKSEGNKLPSKLVSNVTVKKTKKSLRSNDTTKKFDSIIQFTMPKLTIPLADEIFVQYVEYDNFQTVAFKTKLVRVKLGTPTSTPITTSTPEGIASNDNISNSLNASGIEIFKKINSKEAIGKNIMISPTSLYTALAMLINGADKNTLTEMKEVLKMGNVDILAFNKGIKKIVDAQNRNSDGVELSNANSIWINNRFQNKVSPSFKDICSSFFNAEPGFFSKSTDNSIINQWCSDKTKGKIKNVLAPIDTQNQVLFLINALYMRSTWEHPFSAKKGTIMFDTGSAGIVYSPYMTNKFNCDYQNNGAFEAIRLPYNTPFGKSENSKTSMYVILPAKGKNIDDFINKFTIETWNNSLAQYKNVEVDIRMPKFKMESNLEKLIYEYSELGMPSVFNKTHANLKKIGDFSPSNLYVDMFKHKTFIEVNEKGTEAAAVTAISVEQPDMMVERSQKLIIDRSFIYTIVDKQTGAILFMGKVVNPKIQK